MKIKGYGLALASGLAFSIFSVLGKPFLAEIHPALAAGIAYLGAGVAFVFLHFLRHPDGGSSHLLADFSKDLRPLLAVIFFGSIVGPFLFFAGLKLIPATTTVFLSNFEVLFTVLLAAWLFHEKLSRKSFVYIAIIFAGGVLLTTNGKVEDAPLLGAGLVLGGCLSWAIDNNLSKLLIKRRGSIHLATVKSLLGGLCLTGLSFLLGFPLTSAAVVFFLLGIVLAASIISFFMALDQIGAARAISSYSTYSLFGTVLAVALLGESISLLQTAAGLVMVAGVWLLARG